MCYRRINIIIIIIINTDIMNRYERHDHISAKSDTKYAVIYTCTQKDNILSLIRQINQRGCLVLETATTVMLSSWYCRFPPERNSLTIADVVYDESGFADFWLPRP